jgi:hypothetical protein
VLTCSFACTTLRFRRRACQLGDVLDPDQHPQVRERAKNVDIVSLVVDILTGGSLVLDILSGGNLEVDILTGGFLKVDIGILEQLKYVYSEAEQRSVSHCVKLAPRGEGCRLYSKFLTELLNKTVSLS